MTRTVNRHVLCASRTCASMATHIVQRSNRWQSQDVHVRHVLGASANAIRADVRPFGPRSGGAAAIARRTACGHQPRVCAPACRTRGCRGARGGGPRRGLPAHGCLCQHASGDGSGCGRRAGDDVSTGGCLVCAALPRAGALSLTACCGVAVRWRRRCSCLRASSRGLSRLHTSPWMRVRRRAGQTWAAGTQGCREPYLATQPPAWPPETLRAMLWCGPCGAASWTCVQTSR